MPGTKDASDAVAGPGIYLSGGARRSGATVVFCVPIGLRYRKVFALDTINTGQKKTNCVIQPRTGRLVS